MPSSMTAKETQLTIAVAVVLALVEALREEAAAAVAAVGAETPLS